MSAISNVALAPLDNPKSWANMAVRCAAGGGITEASRVPGVKSGAAAPLAPATSAAALARTQLAAGAVQRPATNGRPPIVGRTTSLPEGMLSKRGPGACHNCDVSHPRLDADAVTSPRPTRAHRTPLGAPSDPTRIPLGSHSDPTRLRIRRTSLGIARSRAVSVDQTSTGSGSTTALGSRRPVSCAGHQTLGCKALSKWIGSRG